MNNEIFDDLAIEKAVLQHFGLKITIQEVIVRNATTGIASRATVFKTTQNILYVYIQSPGSLLLADVLKIVRRMNIEADLAVPPHQDADYFKRIGAAKFKTMFPGKHITSADDTRYYETLAPYNPALLRIAKVKGEIRGLATESGQWRKIKEFVYVKMKVD